MDFSQSVESLPALFIMKSLTDSVRAPRGQDVFFLALSLQVTEP